MNNEDMKVRSTGRLTFTVKRADETAVSATFIMEMDSTIITKTVAYDSDGIAYFEIGSPDTDIVGVHNYQVNENFASGSPDIYPNFDDCDGDCEFPTVEICESLPSEPEGS